MECCTCMFCFFSTTWYNRWWVVLLLVFGSCGFWEPTSLRVNKVQKGHLSTAVLRDGDLDPLFSKIYLGYVRCLFY